MDSYLIFVIVLVLFFVIAIPLLANHQYEQHIDVKENWSCEDVKEHIKEKGDTKHGFYVQQLLTKDCSFP